jgi:hypothetical protein
MATKQQFLTILQREVAKHEWAKDPERLAWIPTEGKLANRPA